MAEIIFVLSAEEKRVLAKVWRNRVRIFFIFLLPLLLGILFVLYHAVQSFFHNNYDLASFAAVIFFPLVLYGMGRYFIPLYRGSWRYRRATHKRVVETRVLRETHWWTRYGYRYLITTEFRQFDSGKHVILMPGKGFADLKSGDSIKMHFLHNSRLDILRIE